MNGIRLSLEATVPSRSPENICTQQKKYFSVGHFLITVSVNY